MKSIAKPPLTSALLLLVVTLSSRADVTVYDNLGTAVTGATSQSDANAPTFGDSLTLSQAGTLLTFSTSLYNSTAGGNTGSIQSGSMQVNFYDNTLPYSGGPLTAPLIGSALLLWDFTGGGGLPPGYYSVATFDFSSLGMALPQHVLVTQQFTQSSGDSTRNGVILFSDPVVGSSPNTIYINSSSTTEGLYTFSGNNPGQIGYTLVVSGAAGNQPPVATPQTVSVHEDTSVPITLTAIDPNGDPLSYSVLANPTNGILTGTSPNLVYQPNLHYLGPDAFTFQANDGQTDSAPATVSITVTPPSAGLIIIPVWDATILNDPNAAAIMNTINAAIQVYEPKFSDPVTVTITFAEMNSGLGQSSTYIGTIPYASYYNALVADSKTTNDAIALAHIPVSPSDPVNNGANITLTTANLRALGFAASPPGGQSDSTVSVNMSLINLTRTSINPNKYDLMAVVSHEMDEVLGTISGVGEANIFPADLYRYDSNGARNWTTAGDDAYFSIDGTTDLARYNQNAGGDYGDWWSVSAHSPVRVQDAFGSPGETPDVGVELTVLDVVGWDLVVSPPASAPSFLAVNSTNGMINFSWSSVSGRNYQVQYTTNLNPSIWNDLGGSITANDVTTTAADNIGPDDQRYYRVELLPANGPSPATRQLHMFTGPLTPHLKHFRPQLGNRSGLTSPLKNLPTIAPVKTSQSRFPLSEITPLPAP